MTIAITTQMLRPLRRRQRRTGSHFLCVIAVGSVTSPNLFSVVETLIREKIFDRRRRAAIFVCVSGHRCCSFVTVVEDFVDLIFDLCSVNTDTAVLLLSLSMIAESFSSKFLLNRFPFLFLISASKAEYVRIGARSTRVVT